VTAKTTLVSGATCSAPVQRGNVTLSHCANGIETWSGDITGIGIYEYDKVTNLSSGTAVLLNGVETIFDACVLDTCEGNLYSTWHEHDLSSGSFLIEQSFHGGTGPFTRAHGSIRIVDLDLSVYSGQVGI
jgi:hypothetical protein